MDRREALTKLTLLIGGAVSAPTFAAFMNGCAPPPESELYSPSALGLEAYRTVGELAELILPETDTPGALAAGVDRHIDNVLATVYTGEQREEFFRGMQEFTDRAVSEFGAELLDLSPETQREYLVALEREAYPGYPTQDGSATSFYRQVKELTVTGFYTSEVGATLELHVMPYGRYRPIVPFEEIEKAWA